jgi:hypothetical protein
MTTSKNKNFKGFTSNFRVAKDKIVFNLNETIAYSSFFFHILAFFLYRNKDKTQYCLR